MRPKYKVTGCARFFIFFIIFIPIVYFGAAYIRGENGMQMLKDFYHKVVGSPDQTRSSKDETPSDKNETYTIEDLQKEIDKAKAEIRDLENEIKEKEKEIERLKTADQGN